MGEPLLQQVAEPVERFGTRQLRTLIADMDDTMRALNGAGLAAPQIGVSLRVVIFEVLSNPRYRDAELCHRAHQPSSNRWTTSGRLGGLPVGAGPAWTRAAVSTVATGIRRQQRCDGPRLRIFTHASYSTEVDRWMASLPDAHDRLRSLGFEDVLFPDASSRVPD
jgi:hypothetical protein